MCTVSVKVNEAVLRDIIHTWTVLRLYAMGIENCGSPYSKDAYGTIWLL